MSNWIERLIGGQPAPVFDAASPEEPTYPCVRCPTMRTKAEGGAVSTICDECYDKEHPMTASEPRPRLPAKMERANDMMGALGELEDAWAEYADWRADTARDKGSFSLKRMEDARLHLQWLINVPAPLPEETPAPSIPWDLKAVLASLEKAYKYLPDHIDGEFDSALGITRKVFERVTPPSPSPEKEPPAELKEALDNLQARAMDVASMKAPKSTEMLKHREVATARMREARAAISALFDRQRIRINVLTEDRDSYRRGRNRSDERVSSLESQLARQREELRDIKIQAAEVDRLVASLSAEVERLKAEQITPEEADHLLRGLSSDDSLAGSAFEKLERIRLSAQPISREENKDQERLGENRERSKAGTTDPHTTH